MRIGIDLHTLNNFMQGSRTYAANITRSLLEMDKLNEYFLYVTENRGECKTVFHQKNVNIKTVRPRTRFLRIPIGFPVKLAMDDVDIFHCQYMGPPIAHCPYVLSLHDIIHETSPEFYPKTARFLMSLFYPISARRAARVLTISEYSKRRIMEIYRIPEEKIRVTYCGVSDEFRKIEDTQKIANIGKKYGIHGPYILFVGRIEPRKNIHGLLKAYEILKATYQIEHQLVIAGMKDSFFEGFYQSLRRSNAVQGVIFTGGVSQEDLPYIYNGSDLFVYPSFAEGFGLPVLEAMACGTAVITSNSTALPEVVGNAGIMVDPKSAEALAAEICIVLKDPDVRKKMEHKGLEQAKIFSWHKTAESVLSVYREVHNAS